MAEVVLGGTVAVCCVHGREKRIKGLMDNRDEKGFVQGCLCCENMFVSKTDAPSLCVECSPKIIGGGDRVG